MVDKSVVGWIADRLDEDDEKEMQTSSTRAEDTEHSYICTMGTCKWDDMSWPHSAFFVRIVKLTLLSFP